MVDALASPILSGTDAHLWTASLDVSTEELAQLALTLSASERQRAARFHFPLHRDRFVAGRGQLRLLLGNYVGQEPRDVQFSYGPAGKPALAGNQSRDLHFNLAHSGGVLAVVITRTGPVGVDVERIRPLEDAGELVARFFSARENAAFKTVPELDQAAAFFNLWTRKEAWLKATGEGIGHSLHLVEVSFLPGEPEHLLRLPPSLGDAAAWRLKAFSPAPGFIGAVALSAAASQVKFHYGDGWVELQPEEERL